MKKLLLPFFVFVLLLGALVWYSLHTRNLLNPSLSNQKPAVATTIFPLYDIARNIAGEKMTVIQIMQPGSSVHTFEVTPELISKLYATKVIFKIGNGLDDWTDSIGKNLNNIKIVPVSQKINLRSFPDKSVDPHYWLSIPNAIKITQNISEELSAIDPQNKEYYDQNAKKYIQKLTIANDELKQKIGTLNKKEFATFHEAWYYFAEEYDLKIVASFEEFPGKEPTPEYLVQFITAIKNNNINALFSEPQFSSESISQAAADLNLTIESINPMDGGGQEEDEYVSIMLENADRIVSALKK